MNHKETILHPLHIHHAFIKKRDFTVMADIVQTTCYLEAACIKVIGLCGKYAFYGFLILF
jgi:hypothetical protein